MKWTPPKFSRQEVNAAGKCLIADENGNLSMQHEHMLEVINNWRSAHGFPLQVLKMTLRNRAKKIDEQAIIAQRLKRLSSIDAKLRVHSDWMKLTQMQDVGGCRAVVANMNRLNLLIADYQSSNAKNPTARHTLHKENDYIAQPKPDGYRSYHLVYRYCSVAKKHRVFNDLKIEIQLRTRLQHAWATAVETVGTFSGQPLKSGGGEADWRRFFALMGSAIAMREKSPVVPGTPCKRKDLIGELRSLKNSLNVITVLEGWRTSLHIAQSSRVKDAAFFLLEVDPELWRVNYTGFTKDELDEASQKYLVREKEIAAKAVPGAQVVLAAADSLKGLRRAFPNYYLDTRVFIEAMRDLTK
jgi:ppGpp synthetase/RelA/SpoT-type nucleotidyltranferase